MKRRNVPIPQVRMILIREAIPIEAQSTCAQSEWDILTEGEGGEQQAHVAHLRKMLLHKILVRFTRSALPLHLH